MSTLLGTLTKPTGGASPTVGTGKEHSSIVECTNTGILEEIGIWTGTGAVATELFAGIFNCDQVTGKPEGEPLAKGKLIPEGGKVTAETFYKIVFEGGNASIVKGTKYAIALMEKGGSQTFLITGVAGHTWKGSNSVTSITKPTEWVELNTNTFGVWGGGTLTPHETSGSIKTQHGFSNSISVTRTTTGSIRIPIAMVMSGAKAESHETRGAISWRQNLSALFSVTRTTKESISTQIGMNSTAEGEIQDIIPETDPAFVGKLKAITTIFTAVPAPMGKRTALIKQFEFFTSSTTAGAGVVTVALVEDEGGKPSNKVVAEASTNSQEFIKEKWYKTANSLVSGIAFANKKYWFVLRATAQFNIRWQETTAKAGAGEWYKAKTSGPTKASEVPSSEWLPQSEELGSMNIVAMGNSLPQTVGSISNAHGFSSKISTTRTVKAELHTKVEINGEGQGPSERGRISTPTLLSSVITVNRSGKGAISMQFNLEGVSFGGSKYGPGAEQQIQTFAAKKLSNVLAVVISGGGWVINQWLEAKEEAVYLQKNGPFAVINPNYTHATPTLGSFPQAWEDIELAIKWALENHTELNMVANPNIYLYCGSAGGHIGAMVAARMNSVKPGSIKKCVMFSGIYDIVKLVEEMELGEPYRETLWPTGSVNNLTEHIQEAMQQSMNYINPYTGEKGAIPPEPVGTYEKTTTVKARALQAASSPSRIPTGRGCQYLLYNNEEDLIPNSQVTVFKARLEADGNVVTFRPLSGKGHAFGDWKNNVVVPSTGLQIKTDSLNFLLALEVSGEMSIPTQLNSKVAVNRSVAGKLSTRVGLSASSNREIFQSSAMSVGKIKLASSGVASRTTVGSLSMMAVNFAQKIAITRTTTGSIHTTISLEAQSHAEGRTKGAISMRMGMTPKVSVNRAVSGSISIPISVQSSTFKTVNVTGSIHVGLGMSANIKPIVRIGNHLFAKVEQPVRIPMKIETY